MNMITKRMLALALLGGVAACGQSGSGDNQAAAPANDQMMSDNMSMNDSAMVDASNPYAGAEMKMHSAMVAAVGADLSDTWVRKMIEHHRGAVDMSNVALGQTQGKVHDVVQKTIDKQNQGIADLQKLVKEGGQSDNASAQAYRDAEVQMHDRMMAAKGADPAETWIRKMIEHHKGAIAMSDVVIAQGKDPRVISMARQGSADQRKDIVELERLLSGGSSGGAAAPSGGTTNSSSADAQTQAGAASGPKAKPKGATKPDSMDMSMPGMKNMSH